MDIVIRINTENAAFEDGPMDELLKVLTQAALKLDQLPVGASVKLKDSNGNSCGSVEISYPE